MDNTNKRLQNLDLLKVISLVFMALCHIVIRLASHHDGYEADSIYILADDVFGSYLGVAHAFMFAMGVGIIYSSNQTPTHLIKRGVCLLILSYILNFFRYGIYALAYSIIEGEFISDTLLALTCHDILDFAGLALIVTGLLRLLKLKTIHILLIGIALSIIGGPLAFVLHYNWIFDYFIGFFITTTEDESCFVFFSWYIFVCLGAMFGEILKKANDKDKLYRYTLIISSVILVTYITLTSIFGFYFLTKQNYYYACSILEVIGFLSIDFFLLSVFHFLLRGKDDNKDYWYTKISKNVTPIYFIHWCIIGFLDSTFGYLLEIEFPYYVLLIMGFLVLIVSILLSDILNMIKKKRLMKKASIVALVILLLIGMVACGGKTRKDDFFSSEELDSLHLAGLPEINYQSSLLKTYVGSMEGYFAVQRDGFVSYSEEVLAYFKNSNLIYGGIIPGTKNSLAGAFPSYNWTTYDHACLYEKDKDSYLYFYKTDGENSEYCISIEYGLFTQKNNNYNVYISIKSTTMARSYIYKDNYLEIELTKEYIEENNLLNIYYKKNTFDDGDHEFLYISLDLDIVNGKIDIDVNTMYHGNKEKAKLKCYQLDASLIADLSHYYNVIKPYSDGDLQITDYIINEGIILIEKTIDSAN